jgi:hypothetical protein
MNKLKALLVPVAIITVGGLSLLIAYPRQGTTRGELLDAGIEEACDVAHLECQVRNHCRSLPDGGQRPRYGTVEVKGYLCQRQGIDALVVRWPRNAQRECYELIGDNACRFVTDAGTCTDPSVCDDSNGTPVRQATDRCACRRPDAGQCRTPNPDGGTPLQTPLGVTIQPPFGGAGCVAKPCDEFEGEQGESWPEACPR